MHKSHRLKEIPSQTAGPFLHIGCVPNQIGLNTFGGIDLGSVLLSKNTEGKRITLTGKVFDGKNINARSNMLLGSMYAGKAFANSPVAAVHALAYPIGGLFNISHGLSNSLVLPHVLKFNSLNEDTRKNYAYLAPYVFKNLENSKNDEKVCNHFIDLLENLSKKLKLPYRLRDLGIPEEACNSMAKEAMKQTRLLVNNPRKIEESDAFNIYKAAW